MGTKGCGGGWVLVFFAGSCNECFFRFCSRGFVSFILKLFEENQKLGDAFFVAIVKRLSPFCASACVHSVTISEQLLGRKSLADIEDMTTPLF